MDFNKQNNLKKRNDKMNHVELNRKRLQDLREWKQNAKVNLRGHKNCVRAAKSLRMPLALVKDLATSLGYR